MTARTAIVLGSDGQLQQLQAGDTLGAPVNTPSIRGMTNGEASAAIVIGTPIYEAAADSVKRGQANAKATSGITGLVYDASIAAGASGNVATGGVLVATTAQWDAVVTGETGGLIAETNYFLDPVNVGKLTATPPTTVGQVNALIGVGLSTTELLITLQRSILL